MDSVGHVTVPIRVGGKKMRKRKELDALAKRAYNHGKRNISGTGLTSNDQLLSQSTDDQEDYMWTKVRSNSRHSVKQLNLIRICGPFILVTCLLFSLGFVYWLYFDIKEQIADYRIKIEQVTTTNQNVPEALQKWHETTKSLEQNQSNLFEHIADIQKRILFVTSDIDQLKEQIHQLKEPEISQKQIDIYRTLQTKLEDLGTESKNFIDRITKLEADVEAIKNVATKSSTFTDQLSTLIDNTTQLCLNSINQTLNPQIEALYQNLSSSSDGLRLKIDQFESKISNQAEKLNSIVEQTKIVSEMFDKKKVTDISELQKQIELCNIETSNLTIDIKTLQSQYVTSLEQYESLAKNLSALTQTLDEQNKKAANFNSEDLATKKTDGMLVLNSDGRSNDENDALNNKKLSVIDKNNLNNNEKKESSQIRKTVNNIPSVSRLSDSLNTRQ